MALTVGMYLDEGAHVSGHTADVDACEEIERVIVTGGEQARQWAEKMGKAQFVAEAWPKLVADESVPLLVVLTNNRDAGRLTLQAVQAGKYVYGEKPGAHSAEQMERIVAAAQQSGGHFVPCYARRTFPDTVELRRLLRAGVVGELWSFHCTWITSSARLRGVHSWLFSQELAGGGILHWLGCHWLDLLRFVTGQEVVLVSALLRTCDPDITVEDVACLALELQGGAIGTLRAGYLLDPSNGYQPHELNELMNAFEGSSGSVVHFPGQPAHLRVRTRAPGFWALGETRELTLSHTQTGYAPMLLRQTVAAVLDRTAPPVTEVDAWQVLRVAEAARQSSRTGIQVRL